MLTSYRDDQDAAGPIISLARHGAACSFKSNNVFMTPTGEDNQYTCNMLIRREYRTLLLPTKQDKLLVNAIIRWTTNVDQLRKLGRPESTNIGFCWIFLYSSSIFFIRIKNYFDQKYSFIW